MTFAPGSTSFGTFIAGNDEWTVGQASKTLNSGGASKDMSVALDTAPNPGMGLPTVTRGPGGGINV